MKVIRWFLGKMILLLDALFRPKKMQRSDAAQKHVNQQAAKMSLYQFQACPFCVKVRRAMTRLNVPIQTRDAKIVELYRNELLQQGGKVKVPCLRIEDGQGGSQWMYESSDIVAFLEKQFSQDADT